MDAARDTRRQLGQVLVERGLLDEAQLAAALAEGERSGRMLGEVTVGLGFASPFAIANALAEQHGGPLRTEYGLAVGPAGADERSIGQASPPVSPLVETSPRHPRAPEWQHKRPHPDIAPPPLLRPLERRAEPPRPDLALNLIQPSDRQAARPQLDVAPEPREAVPSALVAVPEQICPTTPPLRQAGLPSELQEQLAALRSQLAATVGDRDALRLTAEDHQADLADREARLAQLESQLAEAVAEREALTVVAEAHRADVLDRDAKLAQYGSRFAEAYAERDALRVAAERQRADALDREARLTQLESQLAEVAEASARHDGLERTLHAAQEELVQARRAYSSRLADLGTTLDERTCERDDLQQRVNLLEAAPETQLASALESPYSGGEASPVLPIPLVQDILPPAVERRLLMTPKPQLVAPIETRATSLRLTLGRPDRVGVFRDYLLRLGASVTERPDQTIEVSAPWDQDDDLAAYVASWSKTNGVPLAFMIGAETGDRSPASPPKPKETGGIFPPPRLGELLIRKGLLTEEQLSEGLAESRHTGDLLGRVLLRSGSIFEDELARTLANQLQIPYVSVLRVGVDPSTARLLPREVGFHFGAIPVRFQGSAVLVAFADPTDVGSLEAVRRYLPKLAIAVAELSDIELTWRSLYPEPDRSHGSPLA